MYRLAGTEYGADVHERIVATAARGGSVMSPVWSFGITLYGLPDPAPTVLWNRSRSGSAGCVVRSEPFSPVDAAEENH